MDQDSIRTLVADVNVIYASLLQPSFPLMTKEKPWM